MFCSCVSCRSCLRRSTSPNSCSFAARPRCSWPRSCSSCLMAPCMSCSTACFARTMFKRVSLVAGSPSSVRTTAWRVSIAARRHSWHWRRNSLFSCRISRTSAWSRCLGCTASRRRCARMGAESCMLRSSRRRCSRSALSDSNLASAESAPCRRSCSLKVRV